ncbi:hypothetical protein EVA_13848 [gut metagenome]|uniref:Uncharacterized protein n=1 Tax=gut metagenome TaxID=749906 RepID=J9CDN5_9ZZZZ
MRYNQFIFFSFRNPVKAGHPLSFVFILFCYITKLWKIHYKTGVLRLFLFFHSTNCYFLKLR